MIADKWVFKDTWDATIIHRNSELSMISGLLEPALEGDRAEDVLIYGSSGVGKSVSMQYMIRDLRQRGNINSVTVECSSRTPYQIIDEIVSGHPGSAVSHNMSREQLIGVLESITDEPYIVVLDEADIIPDLDVLRELCGVENLSVVAITHEERAWIDRLQEGLKDNFPAESRVEFKRYKDPELVDILQPRARHGLDSNVVQRRQLMQIADDVAGVARDGIIALLAAAMNAEERGHDTIRDSDIEDSFERADQMIREENLENVSDVHARMYELLRRIGRPIDGSEFSSIYMENRAAIFADRDQDALTWRRARDYLGKLEDYKLIQKPGNTNSKKYKVEDATLEADVDVRFDLKLKV